MNKEMTVTTIKMIETLIEDLNVARSDGSIYTYGQIQYRLREILEADEDRSDREEADTVTSGEMFPGTSDALSRLTTVR